MTRSTALSGDLKSLKLIFRTSHPLSLNAFRSNQTHKMHAINKVQLNTLYENKAVFFGKLMGSLAKPDVSFTSKPQFQQWKLRAFQAFATNKTTVVSATLFCFFKQEVRTYFIKVEHVGKLQLSKLF